MITAYSILEYEVFGKFEQRYRSLSDVFYSGGVQADTPVHN